MKDVKRVLYNISVNALKTPPLKVTYFAHLLQHSINILHIFHRPFNRQIDRGIWVKDRRKINLSPSFTRIDGGGSDGFIVSVREYFYANDV